MSKRLGGPSFMIDDSDGEDPRDSVAPQDGPGMTGPGRRGGGPPERKRQRTDAPTPRPPGDRASVPKAAAPVEAMDLTLDEDYIHVRIPEEPVKSVLRSDLVAFIQKRGTSIFLTATKRCFNEDLSFRIKDHRFTLQNSGKAMIIHRYKNFWRKDLVKAKDLLAKDVKDGEAIDDGLLWDDESKLFVDHILEPRRERLKVAETGLSTFTYLVGLLKETENV